MSDCLTLDFSPAVVTVQGWSSNFSALTRSGSGFRVGWLLPNLDVNAASTRYRCFHIARVLQGWGVEHSFFTDHDVLSKCLEQLDAIIIVKRLDSSVLWVVARAKESNKPVFLDLCDDLLHERRASNVGGVHRMVLNGVAPYLEGVVTPTLTMAQRVRCYCGGLAPAIHVIPDIAETEDLFYKAAEFATGKPQQRPAPRVAIASKARKSVVWFGNHGGIHSNFGLASLVPAMLGLREVNEQIPLELVVVSNNEAIFDSVIRPFEVPARYVAWSAESIYTELKEADAALLTTGDDDFSVTKSPNRVLQALSAGVPVVTMGAATQGMSETQLAEFTDCVTVGIEKGLLAYLGPDREKNVAAAMAAARSVLARYSPEELGQIWFDLLARRIAQRRSTDLSHPDGRLVLLLENGSAVGDFEAVLAHCRKHRRARDVIVSLGALKAQPGLLETCARHHVAPTLIRKSKDVYLHRLHGMDRLIVEDEGSEVSMAIAQWAKTRHLSVRTQTFAQFRAELAGNASSPQRVLTPLPQPARNPGPHAERSDPDGSAAWVFVVHERARGWILDAICREIGSRQPESWHVAYSPPQLPPARNYFFSHYSLFLKYFRADRAVCADHASFIWYTHARTETPDTIAESLAAFEQATQVIFTCAANRDLWLARGLRPERGRVVLGGADPALFQGHRRGDGVIGLSSSFYERKNPDRLLELVRMLPHRRFHLIGRKWEQYALFEGMNGLPNFEYLTLPYEQYPEQYGKFDVFLSMSTLEGGPIPLLEAMMCNAVPVASRTGFAPDLIRHAENGFLFDIDAPAAEIAWYIEAAFQLESDVRASVLTYDWNNFAKTIAGLGR